MRFNRTILLNYVQVVGTFSAGTKLITVHDPVSSEIGNLELPLHRSFLPAGKLPKNNGFKWRGNSGLQDGATTTTDVKVIVDRGKNKTQFPDGILWPEILAGHCRHDLISLEMNIGGPFLGLLEIVAVLFTADAKNIGVARSDMEYGYSDGKSIPVTNTGHSILPTLNRPLYLHNVLVTPNIIKNLISIRQFTRDNNFTVEFDAFGFSVKDFLTCYILLRCDSSGDLYPVTPPSPTPHALLSVSPSTWHQRLVHPGEGVLHSFMSRQFISCNKEKSHLWRACIIPCEVKLSTQTPDVVASLGCGYGGGGGRIHDDSSYNEDSVEDSSLIEEKGFNSKPYLVGLMKQLRC
ncbi:ribonuclease H-like domain-containing protein [Tanacetum coccineum]